MEDPTSEQVFRKAKPQKKKLSALQPMTTMQIGSSSQNVKPSTIEVLKASKKNQVSKQADNLNIESNALKTEAPLSTKPLIDMMAITDNGDSRRYRSLKRKYLLLEEESFALSEELEKTESEVKQLQEEKSALLDELLVLEGLVFNPYPPFEPLMNVEGLPLSSDV